MIELLIPSCPDVETALDYVARHGDPVRVVLVRGEDGMVRGNALIKERAA